MSESKKLFLIRSDGQILGPFDKEEVIRLIKNGQISTFSEVAEPFSIYHYLRDHSDFKEAIRSMDVSDRLTNFITKTARRIQTFSQTQKSRTKTDTAKIGETTEGGKKELSIEERQSAQKVVYEVQATNKDLLTGDSPYQPSEQGELIVRKKVRAIVKISWKIIIFLALSLTAYIAYKEFLSPLREKQTIREDFKSKGLSFYSAGDYKKALPYFEKAHSEDILTDEEKIILSSLLLQDGQLQKATLMANEISETVLTDRSEGFLLRGLLAFFQSDFSLAEKHFQIAWDKMKDPLALLNLSVLELKRENSSRSLSYLELLMSTGYERSIVFYLKALNLLQQNQTQALISYINDSLLLGQSVKILSEYTQELYLILAYSYMREQRQEDMGRAIHSLLNEDPFFEREYKYSSFTAIKSLAWQELYPYCQSLFNWDPQNSQLNALNGFCYLKTGHFERGAKYIEQAKNRRPTALFLSLYAYLLILQEKSLQAEQVFSLIDYDSLDQTQSLPLILKAHLFEQKEDWLRALATWRELLALFPDHLSGLAGVAICSYKLKDKSTADIFSKRALNQYPYHKSLLFLKANEQSSY